MIDYLWRCVCGAVNRSRDHICRNCGEDRPGREGSAA